MNVPGNCNYTHIAAAAAPVTTTVINAGTVGAGTRLLHAITINTKGAASNVCTISDANGTIAVIDSTAAVGTLVYDVQVTPTFQVVSTTGTGPDLTIAWQ